MWPVMSVLSLFASLATSMRGVKATSAALSVTLATSVTEVCGFLVDFQEFDELTDRASWLGLMFLSSVPYAGCLRVAGDDEDDVSDQDDEYDDQTQQVKKSNLDDQHEGPRSAAARSVI